MKSIALAACLLVAIVTAPTAAQSPTSETDHLDVLEAVIAHLEGDYVDIAVGTRAARALRADQGLRALARTADGEAFADALTERLQALTGDGHLNIEFVAEPIDLDAPVDEAFGAAEMERYYGAQVNFGVRRAEQLDGNIGYLDLRVFAPIDMGADTVVGAMTMLASTDALIIDLRRNGGGIGDMADLVASYLFDGGRQPLTGSYDRPTDTLTQRFTQAHVPGRRFGASKPVYILTSSRTFSAAEALAYNLQALERATIVGEVTGGGAHPFTYQPVHPHFVLWLVTARSVNPITGTNWQSVGVQPDIPVAADEALAAALDDLAALQ